MARVKFKEDVLHKLTDVSILRHNYHFARDFAVIRDLDDKDNNSVQIMYVEGVECLGTYSKIAIGMDISLAKELVGMLSREIERLELKTKEAENN